jgi:predicted nucleotidyltransferase
VFEKNAGVKNVFLYGSRAKGNYKKTSDIDLAVCFASGAKKSIASLKSELEDLPIIYTIDLIDEAGIESGKFQNEYERTKQLFYVKE